MTDKVGEFVNQRMGQMLDRAPKLSKEQMRLLMADEGEMERANFRDRDELIIQGFARRIAPTAEHPYWRTWVTMSGLMLRALIHDCGE